MRRASFNSESGVILPMVIIFMLALTIVGLAFLSAGVMENRLAMREVYKNKAFWIAEGGLERTIWNLKQHFITELESRWPSEANPAWPTGFVNGTPVDSSDGNPWKIQYGPGGSLPGDLGGGSYVVTLEYILGEDEVGIESTGRIERGGQVIEKRIKQRLHKTSVFSYGVLFGDKGIEMKSNVLTDSFDSAQGDYPSSLERGELGELVGGDIGTNATSPWAVVLDSNATVNGNVAIGPGGDPTIGEGDPDAVITVLSNADITGEAKAARGPKLLPDVDVPTGLTERGSFFLGGNDTDTISHSGKYSSLIVDSSATLTIDCASETIELYVTGPMEVKSNAKIEVASGTNVRIYLGSELNVGSNGIVTIDPIPSILKILGLPTCSAITFDSNVNMWGAVYAPEATIQVNSNADFFGSIIGHDLFVDSNGAMHYDKALGRDLGSPAVPTFKDWEEFPYS